MKSDAMAGAEDPRKDGRFGDSIGWSPFAFHLIPRHALARVASVFRKGELAGREDEGWRQVPVEEQLNHALGHILAYLQGRTGETHLANAACRILCALELDEREPLGFPEPPGGHGKAAGGTLKAKGRVDPGGPVRGTGDGTGVRLGFRHGSGSGIPGWGSGCRPGPETLEKVLHYSGEKVSDADRDCGQGEEDVKDAPDSDGGKVLKKGENNPPQEESRCPKDESL